VNQILSHRDPIFSPSGDGAAARSGRSRIREILSPKSKYDPIGKRFSPKSPYDPIGKRFSPKSKYDRMGNFSSPKSQYDRMGIFPVQVKKPTFEIPKQDGHDGFLIVVLVSSLDLKSQRWDRWIQNNGGR
jgi:hypothetical protein